MPSLSLDVFHSCWLDRFEKVALKYLPKKPEEKATLLVPFEAEETDGVYSSAGSFSLPCGSKRIIDEMALFSRCDMIDTKLPPKKDASAYWVHSLLYAAYPKYDGVFKGHNGALHVLCLTLRTPPPAIRHCIFQGIGVILMKGIRSIACPAADDRTVLDRSKNWYLDIRGSK